MPKKSATLELRSLADQLPYMEAGELQETLKRLKEMGIETPQDSRLPPGITCPFTETQLIAPCALAKCPYYIENKVSRNCLLEYLGAQDKDALEIEEIAFLLQISPDEVVAAIEQGMAQLRENSEETVGIDGTFHKKQEVICDPNIDEDDEFEITRLSVEPPFLGSLNAALARGASLEAVLRHPSVRLLGVLDSIISEID